MKRHLFVSLALTSSFLFWQSVRAQTPERQIINDAATALGGRERILAVKTLVVEGAGHDMGVGQAWRYDELGLQSDVGQIRDYRRTYDLITGRARFEAMRELQYPFYQGAGGAHQVQGLDGNVVFNVAANGTATRVFAAPAVNARRVEFLRHPLTIVRAALDPSARLTNARTQGGDRLVDVTVNGVTLTLAVDNTTKLPSRGVQMTDSPTLGDTPIETRFG